jgi:hypothetical protein
MRTGPRLPFLVGVVLGGVFATCATPPKPVPAPLPPAPFVCAGPDSVPAFDAVANLLINAAMVPEDASAADAIDEIAQSRGVPLVLCVIGEILPDIRNGATEGRHLEMWQAAHQAAAAARRGRPWRTAFLVREGRPLYVVGI